MEAVPQSRTTDALRCCSVHIGKTYDIIFLTAFIAAAHGV